MAKQSVCVCVPFTILHFNVKINIHFCPMDFCCMRYSSVTALLCVIYNQRGCNIIKNRNYAIKINIYTIEYYWMVLVEWKETEKKISHKHIACVQCEQRKELWIRSLFQYKLGSQSNKQESKLFEIYFYLRKLVSFTYPSINYNEFLCYLVAVS